MNLQIVPVPIDQLETFFCILNTNTAGFFNDALPGRYVIFNPEINKSVIYIN